jgi:hypothetical protein
MELLVTQRPGANFTIEACRSKLQAERNEKNFASSRDLIWLRHVDSFRGRRRNFTNVLT